MSTIFLASKSDKDTLNKYLLKIGIKESKISYDKAIVRDNQKWNLLVIVISPISANSTIFQEAVLKTFQNININKIMRLRLENINVPAGFNTLCELKDWR